MDHMDQNRMLSFFKIKALPSVQSARSGDINQLKLLLMLLQKNVTETSPHHKVDNSVLMFNRTDLEAVRAVSGPRTIVCSCLSVVTAAAVVTHSRTTDTQTTD